MALEDLPEGNVFLLVRHSDGSYFRDYNPFSVARDLDRLQIEVVSANVIRSGALLVRTKNKTSAQTLANQEELLGRAISVEIADRLNTVEAVAFAPSLKTITEEDLVAELGAQGVIGVRRLTSRDGQRSPLLCFRFRGLAHTAHLTAGFEKLPLRLWIRAPLMCRRCSHFGHTQRRCRAVTACCLRCAGPHPTDSCAESLRCCPHCGGPHAAWDRSCAVLRFRLRCAEEQRASAGPPLEPFRTTLAEAFVASGTGRLRTRPTAATTQTTQTEPEQAQVQARLKTATTQMDAEEKQEAESQTESRRKTATTQTAKQTQKMDMSTQTRATVLEDSGTQTGNPAQEDAEEDPTAPEDQPPGLRRQEPTTESSHPELSDPEFFPEQKQDRPEDRHAYTFRYADGSEPPHIINRLYRYEKSVRVADLDLGRGTRARRAATNGFYFDGKFGRRLYLKTT